LVDVRLTSTFALIRYEAAVEPSRPLSGQKLAGLALAPGASAVLVQRRSGR
jgi:hypothetical protein